MLSQQAKGQDYKKGYSKLIDSAFVLRKQKKYTEGIALIKQAILIDSSAKYWAYLHIANFASLDHNNNLAFTYLNKVLYSPIAGNVYWKYYNKKALRHLRSDPRWAWYQNMLDSLQHAKDSISLVKQNHFKEQQQLIKTYANTHLVPPEWDTLSARSLYDSLRTVRNHYPFHSSSRYLCFYATINDTFKTNYLIQLPHNFNYQKEYPMLIVLHGAVRHNHPPKFSDSTFLHFFGTSFAELADSLDFISVYPFASPEYNWMTSDKGFPFIPAIIKEMKKCFNINDSRVYISGHSNGATGSFNYLVKDPTPFAAFSGFNNKPVVLTGGTFIKNALNRNFYNISTDKDYYFPLEGHLKLAHIADSLRIDWHNEVYYGYPHWFPGFPASRKAFEHVFTFMKTHSRNPFQHHLYWQCDDTRHGRCDWLQINELDTSGSPKKWQRPINFSVSHWIDVHDTSMVIDSTVEAFNFPRRSGAVDASYNKNTFFLKTSCVHSFTLYLSPEMVNFKRPVRIFVNRKKVFDKRMKFDKHFIISNFKDHFDRQAVWVNKITWSK